MVTGTSIWRYAKTLMTSDGTPMSIVRMIEIMKNEALEQMEEEGNFPGCWNIVHGYNQRIDNYFLTQIHENHITGFWRSYIFEVAHRAKQDLREFLKTFADTQRELNEAIRA